MLHPWVRLPFWLASAAALALAACEMQADTPAQRRSDPPKVYVETPFGATPPGGSGPSATTARGSRFLVGDGRPFTVTGSIPCATSSEDDDSGRSCSFGAVRSSPGNADVWVALGEGVERHVVFANGEAVRSNGGQVTVERSEGRYKIRIGAERFEIPEAAITPPEPGAQPTRPARPRRTPAAKTEPRTPAASAATAEPASPSGSADPAPAPPPAAPSEP